uniref:Uncharacterized protein n=1 Tax=Phage sp. ctXnn1 TaxID=2826749 RepID=A0A8S5NA17_9VIRU|nr:MAG TPA: hypothetical protein [Phage sp. ctXnn1]
MRKALHVSFPALNDAGDLKCRSSKADSCLN